MGDPPCVPCPFEAPLDGDPVTRPEAIPFDIVLLLDHSGSMSDSDPGSERLVAAKEFIDLAEQADVGISIGLVVFTDQIIASLPLTTNYNVLRVQINLLGDPNGGTELVEGMQKAQEFLSNSDAINRHQAIILISSKIKYSLMLR